MSLTEGYLALSNLKVESITADPGDNNLLALVGAVAVLFLRVTGPYFQLVQSNVKYSNFNVYIQKMEAVFDRCREDASDPLDPGYVGVFGAELELNTSMKTAVFTYAEQHSVAVKSALEFYGALSPPGNTAAI